MDLQLESPSPKKGFVKFLYNNKIEKLFSDQNLESLLDLGNKFQIKELKDMVEVRMLQPLCSVPTRLTGTGVIQPLRDAKDYGAKEVEETTDKDSGAIS